MPSPRVMIESLYFRLYLDKYLNHDLPEVQDAVPRDPSKSRFGY
jgi:hypothetical protein